MFAKQSGIKFTEKQNCQDKKQGASRTKGKDGIAVLQCQADQQKRTDRQDRLSRHSGDADVSGGKDAADHQEGKQGTANGKCRAPYTETRDQYKIQTKSDDDGGAGGVEVVHAFLRGGKIGRDETGQIGKNDPHGKQGHKNPG